MPFIETSCNLAIANVICLVQPDIPNASNLCLGECSRETLDVVGQLSVVAQELDICTINQNLALSLLLHIFFTTERSEAPVLGDNDLLATRELVLGSAEGLESGGTVCSVVSS
jgi:hypothetical protein